MARRRRRVAIVPHTHWDREWYAPFQTLRLRLVDLLDELLPLLERDPSYARFLLDGQLAVVDDYLEVRPEAEDRLRRLVGAGRLAVGPWYVLMDEFLVSGETIVRDLRLGLERAAALGAAGASMVGYLPDMFGHVAQMPQILRLAGMEHAVVWRGVPRAIDRTGFRWTAPDGSMVRAEYLVTGYGNGAAIPDDAKALVRRIAAHEAEIGSFLLDGILFMNGTDHQVPQPWLGRVVAEANEIQSDYELVITSPAEYLADAPTEGLPSWTGELRSGARANLLMGVGSNRVDVKQAAARTERALERRAEPLCALFLPVGQWPARLFDLAWREVIRNAAHDSVCACSSDETVAAVLHRYAEARQIADGLAERALSSVGASMAQPGVVVVNPSARPRGGLVELSVPGEGTVEGAQVLEARRAVLYDERLTAHELGGVLGRIRGQRLDETTLVLARVEEVPGFGWTTWAPEAPRCEPVVVDGTHLANGRVVVEVDPETGTFAVDGLAGFDRLVDGLDDGDTYNYSPPEDDDVVDAAEAVAVELVEPGPLRGQLAVRRTYRWQGVPVEVTTLLELHAAERLVRVRTRFVNPVWGHRLRAWFPLPRQAASSFAECAFAVVERGLDAEGGPSERALPTFPSRRFVQAGGLTVVHEGLLEYEVVDDGGGLALTLLRSTGVLSQVDAAYRPLSAGPPMPLEGPRLLGPVDVRYGVCVGDDVDPYALVDDAFLPLEVVPTDGGGRRPASGSALALDGAEVSAVVRRGGALEVRVYNPRPEATVVRMPGRAGWLVDLRGEVVEPFEGEFPLRPFGIATARIGA